MHCEIGVNWSGRRIGNRVAHINDDNCIYILTTTRARSPLIFIQLLDSTAFRPADRHWRVARGDPFDFNEGLDRQELEHPDYELVQIYQIVYLDDSSIGMQTVIDAVAGSTSEAAPNHPERIADDGAITEWIPAMAIAVARENVMGIAILCEPRFLNRRCGR